MAQVLTLHENKANPAPIPYTKIVEAYGLRKCPKLVEQVAQDADIDIRINALAVLCDEVNNPYSIASCAKVGCIRILANMVVDPDFITRDRASKALSICAKDANGVQAILDDNVVGIILLGLKDNSEAVRTNVYECFYHLSRTAAGSNACVESKAAVMFVEAISKENDSLKSLILKCIYNLVGSDQGRYDAIAASVIEICIQLIKENKEHALDITIQATRTLGFICFDEDAKDKAINCDAMSVLFTLLKDKSINSIDLKSTITMTLMAITSTDEGKRQILTCDGIDCLVSLLNEDNRVVQLNALKVISNAAVYPPNRVRFLQDHGCITLLNKIKDSDDIMLKKHATTAFESVNWKP